MSDCSRDCCEGCENLTSLRREVAVFSCGRFRYAQCQPYPSIPKIQENIFQKSKGGAGEHLCTYKHYQRV